MTERTTDYDGLDVGLAADADLSERQFRFVKQTGADQVGAFAGPTDVALGVLQNKPAAAGRPAAVRILGPAKMQAGGAVSAVSPIKVASGGYGVEAQPGDYGIVGQALTSAASGGYFRGVFNPAGGRRWAPMTADADFTVTGLGVKVTSDSLVVAVTAATDPVGGVIQHACSSGDAAAVALPGDRCSMRAGDAVGPGLVKINATGYFTPTASGDFAPAMAHTTAQSGALFTGTFLGAGADQAD